MKRHAQYAGVVVGEEREARSGALTPEGADRLEVLEGRDPDTTALDERIALAENGLRETKDDRLTAIRQRIAKTV